MREILISLLGDSPIGITERIDNIFIVLTILCSVLFALSVTNVIMVLKMDDGPKKTKRVVIAFIAAVFMIVLAVISAVGIANIHLENNVELKTGTVISMDRYMDGKEGYYVTIRENEAGETYVVKLEAGNTNRFYSLSVGTKVYFETASYGVYDHCITGVDPNSLYQFPGRE